MVRNYLFCFHLLTFLCAHHHSPPYSPRELFTSSHTSDYFLAVFLLEPLSSCQKPHRCTASLWQGSSFGISFYHNFGGYLSISSASWILSSLFFYFCEYLLETACGRTHGCTFFETVSWNVFISPPHLTDKVGNSNPLECYRHSSIVL